MKHSKWSELDLAKNRKQKINTTHFLFQSHHQSEHQIQRISGDESGAIHNRQYHYSYNGPDHNMDIPRLQDIQGNKAKKIRKTIPAIVSKGRLPHTRVNGYGLSFRREQLLGIRSRTGESGIRPSPSAGGTNGPKVTGIHHLRLNIAIRATVNQRN